MGEQRTEHPILEQVHPQLTATLDLLGICYVPDGNEFLFPGMTEEQSTSIKILIGQLAGIRWNYIFAQDEVERQRLERQQQDTAMARRQRHKKEQGNGFTKTEWKMLKKYFRYHCLCCGRAEPEVELAADHIIPLHQGGAHELHNIQPLCQSCNSKKGIKSTDYRFPQKE